MNYQKILFGIAFPLLVLIFSCKGPKQEESCRRLKNYFADITSGLKTGGILIIPVQTVKVTFNVWTKRIGNNPKMKLLLLNGGSGATHEYFECMESFLPAEGIEFIYYDQLGCSNSENPEYTSLWHIPRYVEGVKQVRKALNLTNKKFYLLGHLWDGVLALEYALKCQQNLKVLIISNMMSSATDYGKYADNVLAKQMDPKFLDTIRSFDAAKDFSNPKYIELLMPNFYKRHILRVPVLRVPVETWPEPVSRSFAKMNQSMYVSMLSPSEFGIPDKPEKWDVKESLNKITVPTLVIGAKHDTMDPAHMEWMSKEVKNGTYLFCTNGSHMGFYDDQKTYMNGLISFMKKLISNNFIKAFHLLHL